MSRSIPQKPLSRRRRVYNPGSHVSGWGALVPGFGGQARAVRDRFLSAVLALRLRGLYVSMEQVHLAGYFSEGRQRLILHQAVGRDWRRVTVVVTVQIEANERNDLLVSWFLFEKDRMRPFRYGLYAFLALLFSSVFSQWGVEFLSSIALVASGYYGGKALGLWGRLYDTSPATPYERFDSAILARYVDLTLKTVLLDAGVDENELQVLRFADASWIEQRRWRDEKAGVWYSDWHE